MDPKPQKPLNDSCDSCGARIRADELFLKTSDGSVFCEDCISHLCAPGPKAKDLN